MAASYINGLATDPKANGPLAQGLAHLINKEPKPQLAMRLFLEYLEAKPDAEMEVANHIIKAGNTHLKAMRPAAARICANLALNIVPDHGEAMRILDQAKTESTEPKATHTRNALAMFLNEKRKSSRDQHPIHRKLTDFFGGAKDAGSSHESDQLSPDMADPQPGQ